MSGDRFRRYGGHTPCISLQTASGLIILDAGTGISLLGEELAKRPALPPITILLTHVHLDHIQGLTAFEPLLQSGARITFMADSRVLGNWPKAVQTLMEKPFWPVSISGSKASIRYENLPAAEGRLNLYGIEISWESLHHPQGCTSYKLACFDQTVVLATDREPGLPSLDEAFKQFSRSADILIHDAQFTPEEFPERVGWGHSTWETAVQTALQAQAKTLVLTSHDPSRSDEEVDSIVEKAKRVFPNTLGAREGMVLDLEGTGAWLKK